MIFWLAIIAVLIAATLPSPTLVGVSANDKLQHIGAFALLCFLGLLAYPHARKLKWLVGLAAYGALIEAVQAIPSLNRMSDWRDWLADLVGVAIILSLRGMLARTRRPTQPLSSDASASSNA